MNAGLAAKSLMQVVATTLVIIGFASLGAAHQAVAADDPLAEKLRFGITIDSASAIIGSSPDAENCRTLFTVRFCRLHWKKNTFFSDRHYEADFLGDRLIGFRVCRNGDLACPSAKADSKRLPNQSGGDHVD